MLRYVLAACAALCLAAPAGATTLAWAPQITDGTADTFTTATQTFDPVNANLITFSGSGTFDPGLNWYLWAGTSKGQSFVLTCGLCVSASGITSLAGLGPLGTNANVNITSLQFTIYNLPGQPIFHGFGDETFTFSTGALPEPTTWAMMLFGFGAIGLSFRRRQATLQRHTAQSPV